MLWRAADGGYAYLAYYLDLTASSPRGVTRLQDCRLHAAEDGCIALYVRRDGRRLMLLDWCAATMVQHRWLATRHRTAPEERETGVG